MKQNKQDIIAKRKKSLQERKPEVEGKEFNNVGFSPPL